MGCEKKSLKTHIRQMSNIIACQKLMIYNIPRICRQHVINRVFTSSSFGPHGVVHRAVGRTYRIKRLGVEYWAECHFDCATADFS